MSIVKVCLSRMIFLGCVLCLCIWYWKNVQANNIFLPTLIGVKIFFKNFLIFTFYNFGPRAHLLGPLGGTRKKTKLA